jgi:hypothetical protein
MKLQREWVSDIAVEGSGELTHMEEHCTTYNEVDLFRLLSRYGARHYKCIKKREGGGAHSKAL